MKKIVPVFTLGLVVFSVTIATYTLTKETLSGSKTEYQTFLLINKNQVIQTHAVLAFVRPGQNAEHRAFSTNHGPHGCKSNRLSKH